MFRDSSLSSAPLRFYCVFSQLETKCWALSHQPASPARFLVPLALPLPPAWLPGCAAGAVPRSAFRFRFRFRFHLPGSQAVLPARCRLPCSTSASASTRLAARLCCQRGSAFRVPLPLPPACQPGIRLTSSSASASATAPPCQLGCATSAGARAHAGARCSRGRQAEP